MTTPLLSERVTALPTYVPSHELVAEWRPATIDDVDAIMRMHAESDKVDHPEYATLREEVSDNFEVAWIDQSTDSMLALDADGEVLAYGNTFRASAFEGQANVYVMGTVRPSARRKGIGRELFAWQYARGTQILASVDLDVPGWLLAYVRQESADAIKVVGSFGLKLARYFTEMHLAVGDAKTDVPVPTGVRLQVYTPEYSESTWKARNDSFRDHWGSQPGNFERWLQLVDGDAFRGDLSVIAVDESTNEVVGMVLQSYNEEDELLSGEKASYVDSVGVVREWRGRGLAKALLAEAVRLSTAAGMEALNLDVDADSPTGANALYESLGFVAQPGGDAAMLQVF